VHYESRTAAGRLQAWSDPAAGVSTTP